MDTDYSEVFRSDDAVRKYADVVYAPGTYASVRDERQRTWLRSFVQETFDDPPVLHDFACGTGRVIASVRDLVRDAHGYDVSPEMMARGEADGVDAAWHVVPATGPSPMPVPTTGPALVTAFRFFLNTDDEARHRALDFAAAALPDADAGVLLVENHGHSRSLRHFTRPTNRQRPWFNELSTPHVRSLLAEHGFEVLDTVAFTVLPSRAYRLGALSRALRPLDGRLARLPGADRVGVGLVHVARRTH